ncbi:MAG TPA: hypothetical protein VKR32_13565 [Puia sp.]|nr:hypothetical protein [Puia sp.]
MKKKIEHHSAESKKSEGKKAKGRNKKSNADEEDIGSMRIGKAHSMTERERLPVWRIKSTEK